MNGLRTLLLCLAGASVLAGCRPRPVARPGPNASAPDFAPQRCKTAYEALASTGGVDVWRGIGAIHASAVVTVYDENGRAYVNMENMVIDLLGGSISATAKTTRGQWSATVTADGAVSMTAGAFRHDRRLGRQVTRSLGIILHRVRGPMNLLMTGERAVGKLPTEVGGKKVYRVGVAGDVRQARAYYFGAKDRMLRFVSSGADKPGSEGTVTIYEYKWHPKGLALPHRLRLVRIGKHMLVGQEPRDRVLDVVFTNVRL